MLYFSKLVDNRLIWSYPQSATYCLVLSAHAISWHPIVFFKKLSVWSLKSSFLMKTIVFHAVTLWLNLSCRLVTGRYDATEHTMMMSSNGNIFRVTGHLCGKFTGHRWILRTKTSDASFYVFFNLHLNKQLSKQWWGWWFETPSHPLWRHCNASVI